MSRNSGSVKRQGLVSKERQVGGKTERVEEEEEEGGGGGIKWEKENSEGRSVTRELQIKAISNENGNLQMDKEEVLRRIRQRKRVNKFRAALQALVSSPFSKTTTTTTSDTSWLDHPFSSI